MLLRAGQSSRSPSFDPRLLLALATYAQLVDSPYERLNEDFVPALPQLGPGLEQLLLLQPLICENHLSALAGPAATLFMSSCQVSQWSMVNGGHRNSMEENGSAERDEVITLLRK